MLAKRNGNGPLSSFTYDPFGNALPGSVLAANTVDGSYGYGGSNERITESSLALTPIQMGSRVYLPTLGRFTSVDPVLGGTANNYVYALDPINSSDYSGKCLQGCSGGTIFLQAAISVYVIQPTVSTQRIITASAGASSIHVATYTVRAAANPAYNNSTAMAPIGVSRFTNVTIPSPSANPIYENSVAPMVSSSFSFSTALKSAARGCVGSAAVFSISVVFKYGGILKGRVAGAPFLAAIGGSCVGGFIGDGAMYVITGEDSSQSLMDDARRGFQY